MRTLAPFAFIVALAGLQLGCADDIERLNSESGCVPACQTISTDGDERRVSVCTSLGEDPIGECQLMELANVSCSSGVPMCGESGAPVCDDGGEPICTR